MSPSFKGVASLGCLSVLLASSGCVASIEKRVSEPIALSSTSEIAVLAVMPGVVTPGSEWLRPHAMERLVDALRQRYPNVVLVDPQEAARRLTDRSLAGDYASVLSDFEVAGVVDPARIDAVVEALDVTHLLQLRVGYSSEVLQQITTFLDDDPHIYDTRHQSLVAVARLWGTGGAGPSWEAVVTADSRAGPFSRDREPTEIVDSLIRTVANRLPVARSASAD